MIRYFMKNNFSFLDDEMKNVMKERKVLCVKSNFILDQMFLQVLENKRLDLDASKSKVKKSRKDIMEQRPVSRRDDCWYGADCWICTCQCLVCCCSVFVLLLSRSVATVCVGILLGPFPIRYTDWQYPVYKHWWQFLLPWNNVEIRLSLVSCFTSCWLLPGMVVKMFRKFYVNRKQHPK